MRTPTPSSPESRPPAGPAGPSLEPLAAHAEAARGAFSASTERARSDDLAVFAAWRRGPGAAGHPPGPATLARFVDDMAGVRAPATVRRYVASIAAAHRAAGLADPAESPLVKLALQRMHRRLGMRQKQAHGLTWPLRQQLLAAAGDRVIDARNRALVAVAYDTMLRRAELCAAGLADLARDPRGAATLRVPRGKTDPGGRSSTVYVARDTVAILDEWLRRAGIADGRLFRSLRKNGTPGERLHPSQIPRIFKGMARAAGVAEDVVGALSGHSARVGAAQDMIAAGIELPAILQAGRWKTPAMVSRYGERLLAGRGAAAQLARLQGRE